MNEDPVRLLKYDQALDLMDQGPCDVPRALEELHAAHAAGLQRYDSGEEAVGSSSFVLSRSDSDFLTISCSGTDAIDIDSDRLNFPSLLSRIFRMKSRIRLHVDRAGAEKVICDYFSMPRTGFEVAYQEFFCR